MKEKKMVFFGAGDFGEKALKLVDSERVAFFLDNDEKKWGTIFNNIPVFSLQESMHKLCDYKIVITLSPSFIQNVSDQLNILGINDFLTFSDLQTEVTYNKILQRPNYIEIYKKAINWIFSHHIDNKGIINNTDYWKAYPEVTGYYIPTLIRWGYRDLAIQFAKWLCEIQKEDGSWYDTAGECPCIFDSGQILKGLIAVRDIYPYVDEHIQKGCDWLLDNKQRNGRLTKNPSLPVTGEVSELVHIYCLSPLMEASRIFNNVKYKNAAKEIMEYYKTNYYDDIMNFRILSHFYAYIMEALLDMGEIDLATEAMKKIEYIQKESGKVAAYPNVDWVCSTGLFQLALVWFRLGNRKAGEKAFAYACKLQNKSGGWFGSYKTDNNMDRETNTYFPNSEISWATKYFLDALYYKNIAEFEEFSSAFHVNIAKEDGRYIFIRDIIRGKAEFLLKSKLRVLDAGCGKGCYIRNLQKDEPSAEYYGIDISKKVMSYFNECGVVLKEGSLTCIPYENNVFDIVYTCEALEHAIDIVSAVKEMARVTKAGGKIVVLDKNLKKLGAMEICDWEQWFDEEALKNIMNRFCEKVEVVHDIPYADHNIKELFSGWIGTVKK